VQAVGLQQARLQEPAEGLLVDNDVLVLDQDGVIGLEAPLGEMPVDAASKRPGRRWLGSYAPMMSVSVAGLRERPRVSPGEHREVLMPAYCLSLCDSTP
jgi:hypothetical protein